MSLDGFSLKPLIDELNEKIAGGRIDRVCQPNKQDIYFMCVSRDRRIFCICP